MPSAHQTRTKVLAQGGGDLGQGGRATKVAGGNPWQVFFNERQRSAKAVARPSQLTPSGVLKPEVRAALTEECKAEWASMSAEEKARWRQVFQERREERKRDVAQAALATSNVEGQARLSHWGMGSRGSIVHPKIVESYFASGNKMPTAKDVYNQDEFRVTNDAPIGDLLGQGINLLGCPLRGRNLCIHDEDVQTVAGICASFSALVAALGKPRAKSADALIMCEGSRVKDPLADGPRVRAFVLLTEAAYKPLYQDFTRCKAPELDTNTIELAFPFEVEVCRDKVRLDIDGEEPAIRPFYMTSAELAKEMASVAEEWNLQLLRYTPLSALRMLVEGVEGHGSCPLACQQVARSGRAPGARRQRRNPALVRELLDLDELGVDPLGNRPLRSARGMAPPPPPELAKLQPTSMQTMTSPTLASVSRATTMTNLWSGSSTTPTHPSTSQRTSWARWRATGWTWS